MRYACEHLYTAGGWLSPGWLDVEDGRITAVSAVAPPGPATRLAGFVVPGMPNLHSHAFQLALAGRTESVAAAAAEDDLFTWRERMYRLVGRLQPDEYQAIATHAFIQLLRGGYTSVGEFHYLHHDVDGRRYADPAEMALRLVAAAGDAGIAISLLPTLYLHGGPGQPVAGAQRRFAHADVDEYLSLVARLDGRRGTEVGVGIALHSLRAVAPAELAAAVAGARALDATRRVHIHAAETMREVREVQAALGARPVEWLLDETGVDGHWTLIHATHLDDGERDRLAASGAVAGLCPVTEATLGDGLFPLAEYQAAGGAWGIGSDSLYTAAASQELRMLECGQRLRLARRNALCVAGHGAAAHSGRRLYELALAGGARALALEAGALAPGCRADLVVLDPQSPALIGHDARTVLDAWLLSGMDVAVREVMVGGRFVIRDGHHPHAEAAARAYAAALARLDP